MSAFALPEVEKRDNSVELYLLNHWVRDFSVRDLVDRISTACTTDERLFVHLFKWLSTSKLADNEEYLIEDFRKIVVFLAKNISSPEIEQLLLTLVSRQGKERIRDFMEIHLMHFQQ